MIVSLPLQRFRTIALVSVALLLLFVIFFFYHPSREAPIRYALPEWPSQNEIQAQSVPPNSKINAPTEYNIQPYHSSFCAERYGRPYLENTRDTATAYCKPGSSTNLTCFHTTKWPGSGRDTLCLGQSAKWEPAQKKFNLGCEIRTLDGEEKAKGYPDFNNFRSYWYGTGTKVIFDDHVSVSRKFNSNSTAKKYTILVKREGEGNLWHCLMEIWSTFMTMDLLKMAVDPKTNAPFYTPEDIENTQIVILDEHKDGPYIDLWTATAQRPIIRVNELLETTEFENIIIPLPGASNPIWQGDWQIHDCGLSELLRSFSDRVLDFYNVDLWKPHDGDIVLTFINRRRRRLVDQDSYLEELVSRYPHVKIQNIDFESLSFSEQVKVVRETDVLVGVHGAGLTHGMFLPERSVMVEILPEELNHKGFRNLAGLRSHTYLSVHASKVPAPSRRQKREWHWEDLLLDRDRFLDLIDVAVKSVYNTGLRNYDILTHVVERWFELASKDLTGIYQSFIGAALNFSIADYQTYVDSSSFKGICPTNEKMNLTGIENPITATMNDHLFAYASAQLMIANDTKTVNATVTHAAVRLGQPIYVYSVFLVNLAVILIVVLEAFRTRGWTHLTTFDYNDLSSLATASSRGGYHLANALTAVARKVEDVNTDLILRQTSTGFSLGLAAVETEEKFNGWI
ncbi:hypothetical protein BGAL_0815g00030 [Botrytis galanthina]|uniref:EGF domain-specific O-linked N-acetylglucosamine transferase n=1 Tax=Botrytis galanthina TaxID=278940 RepID=A0A4S8QGQ6_9HELO|nr:hypothetical protein BGAL_0815g00030 [Botrytis galanthina]